MEILQLKVTLADIDPMIYRTVQVPATITLRKRGGDKDYFYPQKKWRASLLALLALLALLPESSSKVVSLADFREGRGHDG